MMKKIFIISLLFILISTSVSFAFGHGHRRYFDNQYHHLSCCFKEKVIYYYPFEVERIYSFDRYSFVDVYRTDRYSYQVGTFSFKGLIKNKNFVFGLEISY